MNIQHVLVYTCTRSCMHIYIYIHTYTYFFPQIYKKKQIFIFFEIFHFILQKSDNCKKGKFEDLQSYLEDELGVSSSSDLKDCTLDFHETISSHLKGLPKNKYMELVS